MLHIGLQLSIIRIFQNFNRQPAEPQSVLFMLLSLTSEHFEDCPGVLANGSLANLAVDYVSR